MDLFTLVARLGMDTSEYDSKIGKARGTFKDLGSSISAKAVAMGTLVARGIEKAADAALKLGQSTVQAAADVAAEKAQFTATFGEMQGAAEKAFKNIEKSTGVFGTRLKNVGTKAFSQFKGAGLDGVDALSMMEQYTNLAADAAAYYDISLEDADTRLRSFLRGNTEAGDAIGLFTSESQRNTYAMEKYGEKWVKLTEAQKQMLMLDVASDIYKQSGAIGQAARESDAWTNVIGNLSEIWRQVQAKFGEPIMAVITPKLQEFSEWLKGEGVQTKIEQFGLGVANAINWILNPTLPTWEEFKAGAAEKFDAINEGLKSAINWALIAVGFPEDSNIVTDINNLADAVGTFAKKCGEVAVLTFEKVTGFIELLLGGTDGTSDIMSNITLFISDVATFVDTYSTEIQTLLAAIMAFWAVSNPFALVITALATIIANWEDVKKWIDNAKTSFTNFLNTTIPEGFLNGITNAWSTVCGWIDTAISKTQEFFGLGGGTGAPQIQPTTFGGGSSDGTGAGRGFATGLDYVPYDDFYARLHEGEAVLTKTEATAWRRGDNVQAASGASAGEIASAVASALDGAFVDMNAEHVGRLVLPSVSRGMARDVRSRRYAT